MKLQQFKFNLPKKLIAQYPSRFRDECKLMVLNAKTGEIEHRVFKDIIDYFEPHDLFVLNDSKVFPASMAGHKEKTNAKIDVFLLRELNAEDRIWDALVDPARKIRIGNKIFFENSLSAEVIDNTTSRGRTLRFLFDGSHEEFIAALQSIGKTPIPTHIEREPEEIDNERFQSIFARAEWAVTAPTASLHFSRELMKRMELKDIEQQFMTVHAGLGNFRRIDVEDLSKFKADSEEIILSQETADAINLTHNNGRRVCAVGSTVLRGIESNAGVDGFIKPTHGWINAFFYPPRDFNTVSDLVVNFHPPLSHVLITTCAYGGYDLVMKAYETAMKHEYSFGTYGDALLIRQ